MGRGGPAGQAVLPLTHNLLVWTPFSPPLKGARRWLEEVSPPLPPPLLARVQRAWWRQSRSRRPVGSPMLPAPPHLRQVAVRRCREGRAVTRVLRQPPCHRLHRPLLPGAPGCCPPLQKYLPTLPSPLQSSPRLRGGAQRSTSLALQRRAALPPPPLPLAASLAAAGKGAPAPPPPPCPPWLHKYPSPPTPPPTSMPLRWRLQGQTMQPCSPPPPAPPAAPPSAASMPC